MSKIRHSLSVIHYTICGAVCFQFTHFLRDDILCLIIIIKSEVWTTTHCLGFGHETMVCAVCLSISLWRNWVKYVKYNLYEAARFAQQVGNAYFHRLNKVKDLSGSLRWMYEGRILLLSFTGWGLFWHVGWWESHVTKISGSRSHHGFVLFFFR